MKTGWWVFDCDIELSMDDLAHIAEQIMAGFTSGEIISGDDEEEEEETDEI